jgi:hypothetical protein
MSEPGTGTYDALPMRGGLWRGSIGQLAVEVRRGG